MAGLDCDLQWPPPDYSLDHFHPDCAGRKWSISLFDRMIHAPGTFRSARSCSKYRAAAIRKHQPPGGVPAWGKADVASVVFVSGISVSQPPPRALYKATRSDETVVVLSAH